MPFAAFSTITFYSVNDNNTEILILWQLHFFEPPAALTRKLQMLTYKLKVACFWLQLCLKHNVCVFLSFLHQHFQTMLKTKLNVLTLRKEPLPTVIFHEPEAIELCSTTPLTKGRTHAGYKVGSHEPDNP